MKKAIVFAVSAMLSVSLFADPGLIKLDRATIDPKALKVASVESMEASPTAEGQYQFIVQPETNFSAAEMKKIKALGLKKIGLIPPNAYIFLATKTQIKTLGETFPLLYTGEYKPGYKLVTEPEKKTASFNEPEKFLIGLASKDNFEAVRSFLENKGARNVKLLYKEPPVVEAEFSASLVALLVKMSEVMNVERKAKKKVMNEVARTEGLMNVEAVNETGYKGKGVTVVVADTGLDSGDFSNIHDDFQDKNVIGVVGEANTSRTDWSDINGHGTHVAGSATGTGAHYGGRYAGTAPEADLYFICIGDSSDYLVDITDGDIERAYAAGGRVINNSWGSSSWNYGGEYNAEAQRYDTISRQYPDLLLIFAAGNENCKIDLENNFSLSYEGVTKNCLTVGASENYRPELSYYYYGMLFDDIDIDDPYFYDQPAEPNNKTQQGMACFSSRGPAKDGRAKPDIVAPGTWIYSTESLYDDSNDGERKSYYTYKFGTSMASPLTAGACADIVQFLKEAKKFSSPSSALVKAVLINGARSMGNGQFDNAVEIPDETPNHVNGFGHVNLYESLNPSCGELFVTEGVIEETGKSVSYSFTKESDGPVSATLCWTDVPGTVGAALSLVNDLDISVSDGENEYFASGKENPSDHLNNCERCQINDFPAGSRIEVKVSGYNLMEGPQAFALCVSGVNEMVPEPALALAAFLFALLIFKKTK
jgi:Subtilisin-like serine proteases